MSLHAPLGTRAAVFARAAEPGFVKTRLIPVLGRDGAAELHRAMVADALRALRGAQVERRVLYLLEPERDGGDAPCALPFDAESVAGIELREQRGAALGERLIAAFDELLEVGAPGATSGGSDVGARAVIIGSDCPALDASVLDRALEELRRHDLVVGPASDGGYVLIGLSRRCPVLFERMPWSTDRVLERTLERAREAGLSAHVLPPLCDVDTAADLLGLLEDWARGRAHGPATRVAMHAMGLAPR